MIHFSVDEKIQCLHATGRFEVRREQREIYNGDGTGNDKFIDAFIVYVIVGNPMARQEDKVFLEVKYDWRMQPDGTASLTEVFEREFKSYVLGLFTVGLHKSYV